MPNKHEMDTSDNKNFNSWFEENYPEKRFELPIVRSKFKEIAKQAYMEGLENGFDHGYEAGVADTKK